MHERPQDARLGQALQVRARLAQALAEALHVADREAPADERVEVDPARDHVATGADRVAHQAGVDQRQVVPARVRVGEGAAAVEVAVALEAAAGVGDGLVDGVRRPFGDGREHEPFDPALRDRAGAGGVHRATSAGAITKPSTTSSKRAPGGAQASPGGAPNATAARPSASTATHGPGQLNARGSWIGTSPRPRIPSQLRHTVSGSGWSAGGAGTSSRSRIATRQALTDPSGVPEVRTPDSLGDASGSFPMVRRPPRRHSE